MEHGDFASPLHVGISCIHLDEFRYFVRPAGDRMKLAKQIQNYISKTLAGRNSIGVKPA
ncbi:MAG: hypothetical protein ACJ8AH_19985 [Stellaceae bacterium]